MNRPERIRIVAPAPAALPGVVSNVVYHGTDTIVHFRRADGVEMRARLQNNSAQVRTFAKGDAIGWLVDPSSVSVLADDPS